MSKKDEQLANLEKQLQAIQEQLQSSTKLTTKSNKDPHYEGLYQEIDVLKKKIEELPTFSSLVVMMVLLIMLGTVGFWYFMPKQNTLSQTAMNNVVSAINKASNDNQMEEFFVKSKEDGNYDPNPNILINKMFSLFEKAMEYEMQKNNTNEDIGS